MAGKSGPEQSPVYADTLYHPIDQAHQGHKVKRKPVTSSAQVDVNEHGSNMPVTARTKGQHSDRSLRLLPRPFLQRVGQVATWTFVAGTVVIVVIVAFLAFLWFASDNNNTRRRIILDAWLTRAVTICSLALRSIVDLQLAVTTAMIAALMMEVTGVRLPDAAQGSIIRAQPSSNKIFNIVLMHMRFPECFRRRSLMVTVLVSFVACVTILIQLTSFALISDIGITNILSFTNSSLSPYNAPVSAYDATRQAAQYDTSWVRKPGAYPAFAEYSEPAPVQDGVVDTGLNLRAFLPYGTQSAREAVRSFSGVTKVLDSRVSCQAPIIDNLKVLSTNTEWAVQLTGTVRPSRNASRLDDRAISSNITSNRLVYFNSKASGVPISCLVYDRNYGYIAYDPQWKLTLCQLDGIYAAPTAGSLLSEFVLPENWDTNSKGAQYLVLNFTDGLISNWLSGRGYALANRTAVRGEWLDLTRDIHWPDGGNYSATISVSLCFSALNMTVLDVDIDSGMSRIEPQVTYNPDKYAYYLDGVRKQLGQGNFTRDERGILSLKKKDSWIPSLNNARLLDDSTMQQSTNMAGDFFGHTQNWTALLWGATTMYDEFPVNGSYPYVAPHKLHVTLVQRIMQQGGTIAFALQSLLTSLASMDYYDQLPTYNYTAPAQHSYYVLSNVPIRSRGFSAVCVVVSVHLIVSCFVTILFARMTVWSDLGNDWQSVSQLVDTETREILPAASYSSSNDIFDHFKSVGRHETMVVARSRHATNTIGLERKERTG